MNEERERVPPGGWKLKKHSFSKMIVWFADNNIRTMYSIDWRSRYSRLRSRETGLKRLRKKVEIYGEQATSVEIYDIKTGQLIEKYIRGKKTEI